MAGYPGLLNHLFSKFYALPADLTPMKFLDCFGAPTKPTTHAKKDPLPDEAGIILRGGESRLRIA